MITITSSHFRDNMHNILNKVNLENERFIVTKYGKPVVIVMSIKDYELMEEIEKLNEEMRNK